MTCGFLSDPVHVTFQDAAWALQEDGRSQVLEGARSPTSPILIVSKKYLQFTRSGLECGVRLTKKCEGRCSVEEDQGAVSANTACLVTDCTGLYGSLVTNVSARFGGDCVCDRATVHSAAMPADGLTK